MEWFDINYCTWDKILENGEYDEHYDAYVNIGTHKTGPLFSRAFMDRADAFLMIYQIIELGYGGNVNYVSIDRFLKITEHNNCAMFGFKSRELAETFLSYPENVELIKQLYDE